MPHARVMAHHQSVGSLFLLWGQCVVEAGHGGDHLTHDADTHLHHLAHTLHMGRECGRGGLGNDLGTDLLHGFVSRLHGFFQLGKSHLLRLAQPQLYLSIGQMARHLGVHVTAHDLHVVRRDWIGRHMSHMIHMISGTGGTSRGHYNSHSNGAAGKNLHSATSRGEFILSIIEP
ncbi:protein of unknown function [Magnetospirillum sp. XM-1]|nr:protein of unknown function [Magnetospirillum sp. XM-1]